jgi:biofilm PGA synthesis N-glycosyltransferase PgaC
MICGPVLYTITKSLLQDFQQLDGISLQGCTMGSFGHQKPLLSNGANLAYPKELFNQLQGFEGNNHLASGDDIFMLEKVKASFPKDIHFLFSKDAIVKTQPESTWKGLVRQRVRWASKTSQTKNKRSIGIGLLVFITNLVCVLLPILSFYIPSIWMLTILFWLAKISVDCIFMYQTNRFFKANISVIRMLQCGLLYPIITCWIVAQSIKGTYTWKGRSYRK